MEKKCNKCEAVETTKWYSGPICRSCYRKQRYLNPEVRQKNNEKCKEYYVKCDKEALKLQKQQYRDANKEKLREYMHQYKITNRVRIRELENGYYKENIQHKIAMRLRGRLNMSLSRWRITRTSSAVKDLGLTIKEFATYIESKFYPGPNGETMSWDNWSVSGWHIDHIVPLASFDLSDPEQQRIANHYTNLQPMWAIENLQKNGPRRIHK